MGRSIEKPRMVEEGVEKAKPWQLAEILEPVQCRLVTMPDSTDTSSKVCSIIERKYLLQCVSTSCWPHLMSRLYDFYIQILALDF